MGHLQTFLRLTSHREAIIWYQNSVPKSRAREQAIVFFFFFIPVYSVWSNSYNSNSTLVSTERFCFKQLTPDGWSSTKLRRSRSMRKVKIETIERNSRKDIIRLSMEGSRREVERSHGQFTSYTRIFGSRCSLTWLPSVWPRARLTARYYL